MVNRADVGATVYKRNSIGEVEWMAQVPNTNLNTTCIADSDVLSSKRVTFSSDNLGALESISYGDNTPTRAYTYDNNGNVKTIGTVDYSQTYNYNSLNLVKDETLVVDGKTLRLDYQYTKLGHLNTITYPEAMGERLPSVNYAANGLGQPTQVIRSYSDSSQQTFVQSGASYYPNGLVHTFTYGNGITHETTLNTNKNIPEQIEDIKNDEAQSAIDIVNLTYDYDNNLNVTSITNTRDLGAYTLNSLTYDDLDRLTATSGGLGIGSSAIQYDGLGNILSYSNDSTYNSSSLTYDYDGNNRLSRVTDTKLPSLNNRDFTQDGYDDRGNVKSNGKRAFEYNLANQMIKSGQSEFLYDGHGRRIRYKKDDGSTEYSMYSHSGQLLYRETSEGYVNYIYFGNRLVSKEGTALTEPASGSEMNYKPFGESIEPPQDDVGYTGHKFDADLGLSYMQARYYDPVIGRFYSNDPVDSFSHLSQENIQGFNRYNYAYNNPYKYTDPDGKVPAPIIVKVTVSACSANPGCRKAAAEAAKYIAEKAVEIWTDEDSSSKKKRKRNRKVVDEAWEENRKKNGGTNRCADCNREVERQNGPNQKGQKISSNRGEADHEKRLASGGEDTTDNMKIRCHDCHKEKTRKENTKIEQ